MVEAEVAAYTALERVQRQLHSGALRPSAPSGANDAFMESLRRAMGEVERSGDGSAREYPSTLEQLLDGESVEVSANPALELFEGLLNSIEPLVGRIGRGRDVARRRDPESDAWGTFQLAETELLLSVGLSYSRSTKLVSRLGQPASNRRMMLRFTHGVGLSDVVGLARLRDSQLGLRGLRLAVDMANRPAPDRSAVSRLLRALVRWKGCAVIGDADDWGEHVHGLASSIGSMSSLLANVHAMAEPLLAVIEEVEAGAGG